LPRRCAARTGSRECLSGSGEIRKARHWLWPFHRRSHLLLPSFLLLEDFSVARATSDLLTLLNDCLSRLKPVALPGRSGHPRASEMFFRLVRSIGRNARNGQDFETPLVFSSSLSSSNVCPYTFVWKCRYSLKITSLDYRTTVL
jgi:hypothetical protein